ncbi:MAG: anhydro-N-acetylmuramic acid kinase [Burkholderiaceae bacterium]
MSSTANTLLYIGLMSGTSLDGVDGVLAAFSSEDATRPPDKILATAYIPFPEELRGELLSLQSASDNEIHREALAANRLVEHYAQCVNRLLDHSGMDAQAVCAIGSHGQTIRHRPECAYTWQVDNPALLAELTGIDVIADFRSRDIAAGGQGAPLVPAFHRALFGSAQQTCVAVNIGGISNISILDPDQSAPAIGFDTGPGNVLMDLWVSRHLGQAFDANGAWAADGTVIADLLAMLRDEPFFKLAPPKSTGRDLFHAAWLADKLTVFPSATPVDVQATLAEFTATTIADAIAAYANKPQAVHVCGGGAYNQHLVNRLQNALRERGVTGQVTATDTLGVPANHVEALAFAWLAHRFTRRQPGNLPSVTGARGPRILGALYPA